MRHMKLTKLDVTTADGTMDVYVHAPAGAGPFPTVILYPDAFGVRAAMHEVGERLAREGYLTVIVNTLYRAGKFAPFDIANTFTNPPERARIGAMMQKANGEAVMADTRSLLDVLAKEPRAKTDRFACCGYCMGGRLAFIAAGTFGERVAAAASFHPGNIVTDTPESPHLNASKVRARLYFGIADNDSGCTPEAQAKLKAALDAAKVRYELEVYTGKLHGFAVTDFPPTIYDAGANKQHWEKLLGLLEEAL